MMTTLWLENLNSKAYKDGDEPPPAMKPGEYRLYGMRFCPFVERVMFYLQKKGIRTEVVNINLSSKPKWYFTKISTGKVPVFEHDNKEVIESNVIMEYLDKIFPETSILPKNDEGKSRQLQIADQLSSINRFLVTLWRAAVGGNEGIIELNDVFLEIEKAESFLTSKYFGGDTPGYTDYLVYPFYRRLFFYPKMKGAKISEKEFNGKDRFSKIFQWIKDMGSLPEIVAVQQTEDMIMKFTEGYLIGSPDYDLGLDNE